jgi:hypothetical protein
MSIWNKVLLGFILVASLAFFYLAARTLKTQQAWRSSAQAFEKAIEKAKQEKEGYEEGFKEGEDLKLGIRQLKIELHKMMLARGRVWYGVTPKQVANTPPEGLFAMVTIDAPDPHKISDKMILYAFEEKDAHSGGKYLGEFKVDSVDEKQAKLVPTMKPDDSEIDRVTKATGTWTLYERLPTDSHDLFTELTEDQLKSLVPQELLAEYLKDGKPAEANDPEERVSKDKKYVRELFDYATAFQQLHVERSALIDLIAAAKRNLATILSAMETAELAKKQNEQDKVEAQKEKDVVVAERDAAEASLKEVEALLADRQKAVQQAVSLIQSMAGEVARIQLEATRKINERTRALMQAGATQ